MNKAESIHAFFSSFGIPAYEENSVPDYLDDAQAEKNEPPYITYQLATDEFRGEPAAITADIWDCSESWAFLNNIVDEISEAIGRHKSLLCDDGYIIVTKGNPFAQSISDDTDIYKRKYLNLTLTFITN